MDTFILVDWIMAITIVVIFGAISLCVLAMTLLGMISIIKSIKRIWRS